MTSDTSARQGDRSLLLGALPRPTRSALLAQGQRLHLPRGATLFAMGSEGDTALLIETGRVTISLSSSDGKQTILDHLGPGEVVGELAVLDGGRRSAHATAATDVTGTLLGRAALTALLRTHPEAALAVITALSRRLRHTNEAYALQTQADGVVRLARVLLRLFDRWSVAGSEGLLLTTPISQGELGDMAGLSRESVNRLLRGMVRDGVVRRDGSAMVLRNRAALEDLARSGDFG